MHERTRPNRTDPAQGRKEALFRELPKCRFNINNLTVSFEQNSYTETDAGRSPGREETAMQDETLEPHRPQFPSAPGQARKAASVDEALAAAVELKPMVGVVRRLARERRVALARRGKMALPPKDR